MAILENDKTIEQLEYSAGVTDIKEFVYSYNSSLYVPSDMVYHKIITKTKKVIIISTIDNLIKGASGQAVQNMNVAFKMKESLGLL